MLSTHFLHNGGFKYRRSIFLSNFTNRSRAFSIRDWLFSFFPKTVFSLEFPDSEAAFGGSFEPCKELKTKKTEVVKIYASFDKKLYKKFFSFFINFFKFKSIHGA